MDNCEKIKKQYKNLLEQIRLRQEECRIDKERCGEKITQFKRQIHNKIEEEIEELIRQEVPADKIRAEAVNLSDKKYKDYVVQRYSTICNKIEDMVENIILEERRKTDFEIEQIMKENLNENNWSIKDGKNEIETNTHKKAVTSKEILDVLGVGLGAMACVSAIGIPARLLSLGTSGLLAWVNDEPGKKERMIQLEEDRLEEINQLFIELKKKVLTETDKYINSLFYNWEKIYHDRSEYLKKEYLEVFKENNRMNDIESTVIVRFAQSILKVRQKRAKFVEANIKKIDEPPILVIKARKCKEEQITDLYMKIHIVGER